jgi:hypothetical protein
MNDKLPHILDQCLAYNEPDIDIITNRLKLPWLKLNLAAPQVSTDYIDAIETRAGSWRAKWQYDYEHIAYQVKGWNGNMLFGPTDMAAFVQDINARPEWANNRYDEDCQCKFFRNQFDFGWQVDHTDPIRQWVSALIPDQDINLVNTYFLPPGGFVFPHRDYSAFKDGLAKIYIPVQWDQGSRFGMYGLGDIPLASGDVFLINNYSLPHWVYNGSDQRRMVISIGANLRSPILSRLIIDSFRLTFGIAHRKISV